MQTPLVDKLPPWLQTVVGVLIGLSGVAGLAQYDHLWLSVLFGLVLASGIFNAAMGLRRAAAR